MSMFEKAEAPHLRKVNLSLLRSNSRASFLALASADPEKSTWTEWSITRSLGHWGLMRSGSPPRATTASLIAAKSTTAGTPVKSCKITRAGYTEFTRIMLIPCMKTIEIHVAFFEETLILEKKSLSYLCETCFHFNEGRLKVSQFFRRESSDDL